MNKKAQGLSVDVIIITIIALLILIVLIAIFLGRSVIFGAGVSECKGLCKDSCDSLTETRMPGNYTTDKNGVSCKELICCVPISS